MSVFSVVQYTDLFLIFSFLFIFRIFFKRVENPCFRCLTTYFQLYSTQAFSDFLSNRYFIGLLDCCLSRIGERIQMAPLHYLCWYIYACYIEFQTYFRLFRNFKCSLRKLSNCVYINESRRQNFWTYSFLM